MLKSKNIYLSAPIQKDALTMFKWINDRDNVLLNRAYKSISKHQHMKWFESIQSIKDLSLFGIYTNKTKKLIGTCQLNSIHPVYRTAELRIRLGETAKQNKGYGTQALKLLLDFAFKDLNLNRIYLDVFSTNKRAINVYKKLGFKIEGTLRKHAHIDGKFVDVVVMGLLRKEYEKQ